MKNVASPKRLPDKNSRGFTLIELLVITAIIGILVSIAIPSYYSYINTAKITLAQGALDSARKTLELYYNDYQQYPVSIDFTTGKDNLGRTVFQPIFIGQLDKDLSSVESYAPTPPANPNTYTLTVKANDSKQTSLTLTPLEIVKTP